jgi:hypothetical protein
MKTLSKLIVVMFLLCIMQSCSKDKCNITMLSFNNKLSEKITVIVYGLGEKDIEAGKGETFHVKPYVTYQYDVLNYWTKAVLVQSEESVDACVSKGINIK